MDTANDFFIIYDEPELVIINKPGGLLAVPGRGPDKQDSVTSRVKELFPGIIAQPSVHRLDMYTSGIMVLAKTKATHRNLSIQFEQRRVHKTYIALLEGSLKENQGAITLSFRLDVDNRPYQIFDPVQGKSGTTHWIKLEENNNITRVEFTPITGRTHQLRLHASHPEGMGTPIVGDKLYGTGEEGDQMFLHAHSLTFFHPVSGEEQTYRSPVPF